MTLDEQSLDYRQFRLSFFALRDALGVSNGDLISRIADRTKYSIRTTEDFLYKADNNPITPRLIEAIYDLVRESRSRLEELLLPDRLDDFDQYRLGHSISPADITLIEAHETLYNALGINCSVQALVMLVRELLDRGYLCDQLEPYVGWRSGSPVFSKNDLSQDQLEDCKPLSAGKVSTLVRLCDAVATGDYPEDFLPSKLPLTPERVRELKTMIRALAPGIADQRKAAQEVAERFGFNKSSLGRAISPQSDQRGRVWIRYEHWNTIKQAYEALSDNPK